MFHIVAFTSTLFMLKHMQVYILYKKNNMGFFIVFNEADVQFEQNIKSELLNSVIHTQYFKDMVNMYN